MKKVCKIFALLLTVALLCSTLTGCIALDEARKAQAFYTPEGDILWNNATYRRLPECDEFQPLYGDTLDTVYATQPEVPVLLKNLFGDNMSPLCDGLFLSGYMGDYCRTDRYDELAGRITAGFAPTGYGFAYYYYDEKKQDMVHDYYRLLPEQTAVMEQVLANTTPNTLPANTSVYFDQSVELELCTDDYLFRRYVADLCGNDSEYYLRKYADNGQTLLYPIPTEHHTMAQKLLDVYSARYGK